MSTLNASSPLNMTTGMAGLNDQVTLQQLMQISPSGTHQFWAVAGGGMSFDMSYTPSDLTAFSNALTNHTPVSINFDAIRFYSSSSSETGLLWEVTGAPLAVTLQTSVFDYTFTGELLTGAHIAMTVGIANFWQVSVDVTETWTDLANPSTYVVTINQFNQSFLPGSSAYNSDFVSYILHNGDVENGTTGNDTLLGYDGNDTLLGSAGNDSLVGANGFDSMLGGDGNDFLGGGLNADFLDGGNGNDVVSGGNGPDTLVGGDGDDNIIGGLGLDSLVGGNGFDTMSGGDMNDFLGGGLNADSLDGGNGDDLVSGGNGPDTLLGGDGNDTLIGGLGFDSLLGGNGDDSLTGGALNDVMAGGAGNDIFNYTATALGSDDVAAGGVDQITDMAAGDKVAISAALANLLMTGGFVLGASTSTIPIGGALNGSSNIAFDAASHTLQIDLDGSGTYGAGSDFAIQLVGSAATTASWNGLTHTFSFA